MNVTSDMELSMVFLDNSEDEKINTGNVAGDYYGDDDTELENETAPATIDGVLIVEDFDLNISRSEEQHSGIGNDEPQARTKGAKEYSLDGTLTGEDEALFSKLYGTDTIDEADSDLEFRLQGDEQEHILTQGDWTDLSLSGAEDEAMTTSFTLTFLSHSVESVPTDADEVGGEEVTSS